MPSFLLNKKGSLVSSQVYGGEGIDRDCSVSWGEDKGLARVVKCYFYENAPAISSDRPPIIPPIMVIKTTTKIENKVVSKFPE